MAKRKQASASIASKKQKVDETGPSADSAAPAPAVATGQPAQQAGDVFVLGTMDCGQAGRGEDFMEASRPVPTLDGHKVTLVECGGMHTLALSPDGTVYSTGVNDEGALGRRTAGAAWEKCNTDSTDEVGDSWTWAAVSFPEGTKRIVALSAGDSHSMAVDASGNVWGWGLFRLDGPYGFTPSQTIALSPQLVWQASTEADQVTAIASGADHVLALTKGDTILTWGVNLVGQLGRTPARRDDPKQHQLIPAKISFVRSHSAARNFVGVAAGNFTSYAVTAQGKVFCWGLNNYGQLGLKAKAPLQTPRLMTKLKEVGAIAGGEHHTLARTKDGKVLSLGRPTYGRLGRTGDGIDPSADDSIAEPGEVQGLEGLPVHSIAAGLGVSGCVAGEDAYLWGMGSAGQLGKGKVEDDEANWNDELIPHKLARTKRLKDRPILDVSIGGQHVAFVVADAPSES